MGVPWNHRRYWRLRPPRIQKRSVALATGGSECWSSCIIASLWHDYQSTSKAFELCLQVDHRHNKKHKIDRLGVNRLGNSDAWDHRNPAKLDGKKSEALIVLATRQRCRVIAIQTKTLSPSPLNPFFAPIAILRFNHSNSHPWITSRIILLAYIV